MQLRLLGDRILVALPPKPEAQDPVTGYTVQDLGVTASGLLLAKPTDQYNVEIATRGLVVQVGEKSRQVDLDDVRAEVNEYFIEQQERTRMLATAAAMSIEQKQTPSRLVLGVKAIADEVDRIVTRLAPAPFDVQVGDCVIFPPSAGEPLLEEGSDVEYVILRESDIIGVVEPKEKGA